MNRSVNLVELNPHLITLIALLRKRKYQFKATGHALGKYKDQDYDLEYQYSIELGLAEELSIKSESLIIRRRTQAGKYKRVLSINQDKKNITAKILDSELIGAFSLIKKGEKTAKIELNDEVLPDHWTVLGEG